MNIFVQKKTKKNTIKKQAHKKKYLFGCFPDVELIPNTDIYNVIVWKDKNGNFWEWNIQKCITYHVRAKPIGRGKKISESYSKLPRYPIKTPHDLERVCSSAFFQNNVAKSKQILKVA